MVQKVNLEKRLIIIENKSHEYQLIRSKRKTFSISVTPEKEIIVKAPMNPSDEVLHEKVQNKAFWIRKQLRYFDQFYPILPANQLKNRYGVDGCSLFPDIQGILSLMD